MEKNYCQVLLEMLQVLVTNSHSGVQKPSYLKETNDLGSSVGKMRFCMP